MAAIIRTLIACALTLVAGCAATPQHTGKIDPTSVTYTEPADMKWVPNAAGTADTAILYGDPAKPVASLIECRLETGRTHQIRVHLTHIGHPLIGDPSYGRARQAPRPKTTEEEVAFSTAMNFPRQALHAWLLGFQHPTLHKNVRFERSEPADMIALIKALRGLKI